MGITGLTSQGMISIGGGTSRRRYGALGGDRTLTCLRLAPSPECAQREEHDQEVP